jgi:abortive infection bacteriophage resistance protein
MEYIKPPLTFEQQAQKLIERGLVADADELIKRLCVVNYYRLSAYLYPFRRPDDSYKPNTTLAMVWNHYTFDRQLRLIVIDAVERVEVAVRTQLVYLFSHRYGSFGYADHSHFPKLDQARFSLWLQEMDSESSRSREIFTEHFKNKYGDVHKRLPLWMLAEIMSFGRMLTFFNGVDDELRRTIARRYGIEDRLLQSWLGALNVVRNICAHHGRLWNRELGYKIFIPRKQKYPQWHIPIEIGNDHMFAVLTILRYLLKYVAPTSHWHERLRELFGKYPNVPMRWMGFPDHWEQSPLWKI